VNVDGANDAPTLDVVNAGPLADTADNDSFSTITGSLVGYDLDSGEAAGLQYAALDGSSQAVNTAVSGLYGSLTVGTDGVYNYVPDAAAINALGDGSYADTFTVQTVDANGATGTAQFTVDVTGVNDAPVFVGTDLAPTYHAGDAAVALAGSVSASDVDSDNYSGGSLTATVIAGGHEGDTLTVVGDQYITLDGTTVMFDADGTDGGAAVAIGTLTDNINSLTIDLNADATDAAVAKLSQAIGFQNTTENPDPGDRTVAFTLHDGGGNGNGGHDSAFFTTQVTVAASESDQAPVISIDRLDVQQNEDGTTTISGLSVSDADATPSETFTISATTAGADSGSTVSPDSGSDVLASVNATLQSGITYDHGPTPTATDMVTLTVADGSGATDTVNFIFNVTETPVQPVTLAGTTAKDVFFGTGYQDQFVFGAGFNHDTVMNFTPGVDHIDLSAVVSTGNTATWFSQHVTAAANPADTLVTVDAADTIVLHNVQAANLTANDFILHVT
jgi:VCBS repeat-containing protein